MANSITLGAQLRRLLELLDGDVETAYRRAGLNFRPRYTPIFRALLREGALSIKDVANLACVTHSAASQTIAQMTREDLVQIEMGRDRRERLVGLTPRGLAMTPDLERCWAATARAAASLDEDLSFELEPVLRAAVAALTAKPFLDRMVGPQDAYKKD
ncbi:MarR family winged helix-turn-helix transcriptional regulator [Brevundimonas vancanneytii]|uniref:MarR family winged helix-turn-helix transcriptional regulator n=1 Tax=Brevundimonas vancanneytii TaxID=1325724 RepID=UPI0034D5D668